VIAFLALSPSLDITYEVPELAFGSIARPTGVTRVAGGKALNAARVAKSLGAEVSTVVALGGGVGSWVRRLLEEDGVDAEYIDLEAPARTCLAIVRDAESTQSTDVYEPATPLSPDEWKAYRGAAEALVLRQRPAFVALAGSLPAGVPPEEAAALLARLRGTGARIVVDGSGHGLRATVTVADLVKINRLEASELLGQEQPDAITACRALRERYGVDSIVTDGVQGAAAVLDGRAEILPPPAARGRFPAGSGDSFLGGVLTGLDRGLDPAEALRLGADAAERNALVPGQGRLAVGDSVASSAAATTARSA